MIHIQYKDSVVKNNLYCAAQVLRHDGQQHTQIHIVRWFGSADVPPPAGRGELVALATITKQYRNERIVIAPALAKTSDHALQSWRNKFSALDYVDMGSIVDVLGSEIDMLAASGERTLVAKTVVKNIPSNIGDIPRSRCTLNDITLDDNVFVMMDAFLNLHAIRHVGSIEHLAILVDFARNNEMFICHSEAICDGDIASASGPWSIFMVGDVATTNKLPVLASTVPDVVEEIEVPPAVEAQKLEKSAVKLGGGLIGEIAKTVRKSSDSTTPKPARSIDREIVEDRDKLVCPYCDKEFSKPFGRTNHVRTKHPDKYDDYQRGYL